MSQIAAFVFFLACSCCCAFDNVLLVSIDTVRSDHVGCYGSKKVKTPSIDRLAERGVLFEQTVVPDPHTLPSHISLLTGLLPSIHGVQDNSGFRLDGKVTTLAEVFRANGMKTGAFIGAFPLDSRFGLDQGFDVYDDSYPMTGAVSDFAMAERSAEQVADSALRWLASKAGDHWFAFVHFYDPHFPYIAHRELKEDYKDDPYAGEISYADQQLGRILEFLKQRQLRDRTLIVLVSDHGEGLGEHGEDTHGTFAYEGTMRVPFVLSPFPKKVVHSRVRLIDVAPTVLAVQKLAFSGKIQGKSLAPYLTGDGEPKEEDSYFQVLSMYFAASWAPLRGFYSQGFKYIDLPLPELYDLRKDPEEKNNLCKEAALCREWAARFRSFAAPFIRKEAAPAPVDSETAEQLRALGYISGHSTRRGPFGPEDDPKNLIAFQKAEDQALGFHNSGHDRKALEILEATIRQKPKFALAYLDAAHIYSEAGSPEKSIDLLKKAIGEGVGQPDVYSKLAIYLYEAGRYDEAVAAADEASKLNPEDIDTWNYMAMSYTAAGKYGPAERAFGRALSLDPSDATTLSNMGMFYLMQKKPEAAEEKFKDAIAKNPNSDGAYNGMGVISAGKGDLTKAIGYWEQAVEMNGRNFDAMLNLGSAYLRQDQLERAESVFERFVKTAPAARYGEDIRRAQGLLEELHRSN